MPGTTFSTSNWTGYDEQSVTNPSSALTNFTLAIDISTLSSAWKSNVQSDGGDIRLTKGDDTELPFDLIDWAYNAGSPTGLIRVKWSSTLAASGTQNVRVWAGYTGGTAAAYDDNETYGADNAYDSSWEFYLPDGGFGGLGDRTSNARTATANGGVSAGGGTAFIGGVGSTSYDRTDDYYDVGEASYLDAVSGMTVMVWADTDNDSLRAALVSDWAGTGSRHFLFRQDTSQDLEFFVETTAGQGGGVMHTSGIATAAGFQHLVGRYDGSNVHGWYDGNKSSGATHSGVMDSSAVNNLCIGESLHDVGGNRWDGLLAEVQLHSTARADAWIDHEYDQTNDQATFWGTWAWTAAAGGGATIAALAHHHRMMLSA